MHERAQHSSRVLEHKEELQDTAGADRAFWI